MRSEVVREGSGGETRIAEALDALTKELSPVRNVVEAFRHVMVEKARLKEEISLPPTEHHPLLDPGRFESGVSLMDGEVFIDFEEQLWKLAVQRMLPALERGFLKLGDELSSLGPALSDGRVDGQKLLRAVLEGREDEAEALVGNIGVDLRSAAFILGQIAKPLVESAALGLKPMVEGLSWPKGYCPLCGSMPELAFLKGEEGQRWLRCSFCSHEWRFPRLACPFCETDDHTKLVVFYIAGREKERVEACTQCNRYVLGMDPRGRLTEPVLDTAAIGMVHLDVIAQRKGFLPAAWCAWNLVSSEDTEALPAKVADKGKTIS
jgi:FdhE protein